MLKNVSILALSSLMTMSLPALAQDTTEAQTETEQSQTETETQATDTPAATEAEGTAADQALDLGEPVEPELGQRYEKERMDDWSLACIKTEAEEDPCNMLQILTDDNGNPVAEVSMFRLEGGGKAVAGATVIVPLEVLLPARLNIAVDDSKGKQYNYSFCNPLGCVAQIGLTQADVDAFKRGAKATVSMTPAPAPDQTVSLEMSLKGFTAAFDAVDVVKNQ